MFDTPITDTVVLVVDPDHPRFGQIATPGTHDWRESGELSLRFPDNERVIVHDGLMEDDPPPQAIIWHKRESKQMVQAQERLPEAREKLAWVRQVATAKQSPRELRVFAKKLFVKIATGRA